MAWTNVLKGKEARASQGRLKKTSDQNRTARFIATVSRAIDLQAPMTPTPKLARNRRLSDNPLEDANSKLLLRLQQER